MPTKDSVIRTARLKADVAKKLEHFCNREDLTFSAAISRLVEEMDMPKSRRAYVNTERFVDACERVNQDPQFIIDKMTERILKG